jgi:YVTN family beta-propeller protein
MLQTVLVKLSLIDTRTNTVIDTIPLGEGVSSFGIAFNPYTRDMYVANFVSNIVSVIAPIITTVQCMQWHDR